ncbi:MAG: flagellar protein FliS [Lachnospiraceae bacterium]|nr:flagellar protein FliS [Lachnospiraceae bacterium]
MTKEMADSYKLRITQSNASSLLCVAYDMWLCFMDEALEAFKAQSKDDFVLGLKKVQRVNQEIINMLNPSNEDSFKMMQIHFYANTIIVKSILKGEPHDLDRMKEMVKKLSDAFAEIAKADTDGPIMQHTQTVYAGLTYGRGTLNEAMDPMGSGSRGFTV